jgi:hypothetical protein
MSGLIRLLTYEDARAEIDSLRIQLSAALDRADRADRLVDELATELGVTRSAINNPELFRVIHEVLSRKVKPMNPDIAAMEAR